MKVNRPKPEPNIVQVSKMQDGQIGIIHSWGHRYTRHIGTVVQRYGDALIALGGTHGACWPEGCTITSEDNLIEILPNGTQLTIDSN